jgi:hypothetical protein
MSAHRYRDPTDGVPPAPLVPGVVERHRVELDRDDRVERRLTWRELGCLLFVAVFVLVRRRYLD